MGPKRAVSNPGFVFAIQGVRGFLWVKKWNGAQGQNRTADTGIFRPLGKMESMYISISYPRRPLLKLPDYAERCITHSRKSPARVLCREVCHSRVLSCAYRVYSPVFDTARWAVFKLPRQPTDKSDEFSIISNIAFVS